MKKINIVLFSHWFGITAASGYLEDAIRNNSDKYNLITAGPAHGVNMPWGTVSLIPENYVRNPNIPFPAMHIGDSNIPVQMVEGRLPEGFVPDLWITVDNGVRMIGKPSKGINSVFLTDPHTGLKQFYDQTKEQYDFRFNPQTAYSDGDEYYLPYAADPTWHIPVADIEKIYDVCIIGNYYVERVELMNRLKSRGLRTFFQLGLAKEEFRLKMNQSHICINWSSKEDLTARVFEAMASGNILLANRIPDLNNMFEENKDFYGFSNIDEAQLKVDFIINNLEEAKKVANNGLKRIEDGKHFWSDRLNTILKVAELNG